ncbi:hypothetical protein NIE88_21710 [Sporolactobacillus shoreicorticis]|uniref:Uncharacterized protein n=1 Tax=Sporolactobacillus shoreicorticis TaxID=1923877 RepID=A0ABW5SA46_9BACL|nr:hypothetical protein [Sporolactobacillus shoreicorticis]MCO7128344.1 hypothetical protein [Sporolactobacillus shoreicorticis]
MHFKKWAAIFIVFTIMVSGSTMVLPSKQAFAKSHYKIYRNLHHHYSYTTVKQQVAFANSWGKYVWFKYIIGFFWPIGLGEAMIDTSINSYLKYFQKAKSKKTGLTIVYDYYVNNMTHASDKFFIKRVIYEK